MKLVIPSDWDGSSWACVQVQWPNSIQWIAILNGLLTMAERGRTWDEKTGIITEVQQIGWEIWDKNIPLTPCSEGDSSLSETDKGIGFAACIDSEELEIMGCCSVNPKALKIEDGRLWALDSCGEWVEIGPVGAASEVIDFETNPPPDLEEPPEGYSACGKAYAILEMYKGVITSIRDEQENAIWQWWGHVKADNPGVHMDAKWIIASCNGNYLINAAIIESGGTYNPNLFDESTWQSVLCRLASWIGNSYPDEHSGNEIRRAVQNFFADEWGIDILVNALFYDAARGINRESWEEFANTGAFDTERDCGCPTDDTIPQIGSIWFNGTKQDGSGSGYAVEAFSVISSGRRVKWQIAFSAGTNKNFIDLAAMVSGAEVGDTITVRMYPDPDNANPRVPANTYGLSNTDNVSTDLQMGLEFIGTTEPPTRNEYETYVEFVGVADESAALTRVQVLQGFNYPDPSASDVRHGFIWEITHINGVSLGPIGP